MPDPILMSEAFAAAAVLGLVVALLFGRSSRPPIIASAPVWAVLIATYTGLVILGLSPRLPPREAPDRFLLIVLPAAGLTDILVAVSGRSGWILRAPVAVLAAPILLQGSVYIADRSGPGSRAWPPALAGLVFTACAAVLLAAWRLLNRFVARSGPAIAGACLAGSLLGAGLVIMLSGYATGGQLGIPLGSALAGVALASLAPGANQTTRPPLSVGIVALFSLLLLGRLFASLTTLNAALLFAAPLLGCLPELLPARPRLRAALRLLFTSVPIAVALLLAQQQFAADSAAPSSGDDSIPFGQ